ncbi:MAG: RDD family protein [Phycisphaerales bacterium]
MTRYFYSLDDQTRVGPVTIETLRALVVAGTLRAEHLVFVEGATAWAEARDVPGLLAPRAPGEGVKPRKATTRSIGLRPIRTSEYASTPRARGMAIARGFYGPPEACPLRYRAVAAMTDLAVAGLLLTVTIPAARWAAGAIGVGTGAAADGIMGGAGIATWLALVVTPWLYHAGFECSGWRGSPGKRALAIQVVDHRGERLSFRRATVRHFAKAVAGLTLGIGLIAAWWDQRLRTWHDRIAGARVERTPPV